MIAERMRSDTLSLSITEPYLFLGHSILEQFNKDDRSKPPIKEVKDLVGIADIWSEMDSRSVITERESSYQHGY